MASELRPRSIDEIQRHEK
jgi:serine/threonine-protein kinase SRPK3